MQKRVFTLTPGSKPININVNPENPFIKISNNHSSISNENFEDGKAEITITGFRKVGNNEKLTFPFSQTDGFSNLKDIPNFKDAGISKIQIEIDQTWKKPFEISFEVQYGEELIDLKDPISEFNIHISNPGNTKILFSAPFGHGKTTFLDHFFDRFADRHEVFKVYPVNYAVASNEDIFRYIKTDILFQLLSKNVEFNKEDVSWLQTTQEFLYLHPVKTVANFIRKLMSLDKRTEIIDKAISKLEPIVKELSAYHHEQQVDDKADAKKYIEEIYEREGSIFEDNFYTQLIRQLLERLKTSNIDTILIIEDLDRMDPDHIFRILNVISAHYDTYNFGRDDLSVNKFGFDKIILVCDEENIRSIFHHKYGPKTDFNGYFNKYFSSKPFHYNNQKAVGRFLRKLHFEGPTATRRSKAHNVVLEALFVSGLIDMRELNRLLQEDFEPSKIKLNSEYWEDTRGLFQTSLTYLDNMFGNRLHNKLKRLVEINRGVKREFDYYSRLLIAGYVGRRGNTITFGNVEYDVEVSIDFDDITLLNDIKRSDQRTVGSFTYSDFYELLLMTYEKYITMKTINPGD